MVIIFNFCHAHGHLRIGMTQLMRVRCVICARGLCTAHACHSLEDSDSLDAYRQEFWLPHRRKSVGQPSRILVFRSRRPTLCGARRRRSSGSFGQACAKPLDDPPLAALLSAGARDLVVLHHGEASLPRRTKAGKRMLTTEDLLTQPAVDLPSDSQLGMATHRKAIGRRPAPGSQHQHRPSCRAARSPRRPRSLDP